MKASLAVCILAALLAVGACLQCEVCNGSGNNCTGSLQTCVAEKDTCSVILTETTFAGQKSQYIIKGCAKSSLCKTSPVSMNLVKGLATRTIFACCVGEACRTMNVTVPPAETKPNGGRCPACYVFLFGQCSEETIDCVGAETQCINVTYNQTTEAGGYPAQIIMKGCASESFCAHLKTDPETFTGIRANLTRAECRPAYSAGGVAPGAAGLLLPALAGLLLLKLLS
ncbi:phospholipase A2 inhibitor gamma subunit B-like [Emydura macquarii macquarii]|uniref:phospholipase A2 inhibitor gamma subunit B-like n=1 Tax=Emydura macquarii macquarii TaxID=1129001 RepID=UPI00352B842B